VKREQALSGRHAGQTATIVGRGPSLLALTAADFGGGPVLVLNHAIEHVRRLALRHPLYSLQKDGCLAPPQAPETLILSAAQSARCFPTYAPRYVIDVRQLGLPVQAMSSTLAVALAHHMGCRSVRMLAMDSRLGDFRTVVGNELRTVGTGYLWAIKQATRYAARYRIEVEWA